MNKKMKKHCSRICTKIISIILMTAMLITGNCSLLSINGTGTTNVHAASATINSMEYYNNDNDGPSQTKSGVSDVSFGFVMPKFNGKTSQELPLTDVESDLQLYVKQENGTNGEWKKIQDVSYFVFNSTWGWEHQVWSDTADGWICWFKVNETTEVRFHGKTNNIDLDYKFNLTKLPTYKLTSITTSEQNITADSTGGSATHWNLYTFNGDSKITYDQVKDDLDILVDNNDSKGFVKLLSNASSGFLWDQNFGIYTDGAGGLWFTNIGWSFTLRFQKKGDSSIYTDVKVTYTEPVRTNWTLASFDGTTTYDAKTTTHEASVGIALPKVGGTSPIKKDLDLFTYEVCVGATYNNGQWSGGEWISLSDVASSGWIYQGNGYNNYSINQQWGYFVDTVYGLWFQPVKRDTYIRIGYPQNGQKQGAINDNYVYYTILGDPQAVIPTVADMKDITVDDGGNSTAYVPSGWSMIWNDEFDGNVVDDSKWSPQTGFLLDENDINTAGWGNNELEYYTDSTDNISTKNGSLNITMKKEPKTFSQKDDSSKTKTALYSSGKLVTKDKFSVKYGRVDFRAKLPTGTGIWPALWMMPNDNIYGEWANSGEIDVCEGRGRTPEMVFGTLHFGSKWPGNINTSDTLNMVLDGNKKTDISDWHVYSVIWEEGDIKVYCDGKCYFKCTNESWYSGSNRGNKNAPFDQRFYLIINLAAGGSFDNNNVPGNDFNQADLYVDYVRVYQKKVSASDDEKADTIKNVITNGADDNLYGDYKLGSGNSNGGNTNNNGNNNNSNNNNSDNNSGGTVSEKIKTTRIKLSGISKKIAAGKKIKLSASVTPSNASDKSVIWKSSNTKYATVNSNGIVKTKKAGKNKKVTITATAADGSGVQAAYKIKIMPKSVKKITLKSKKSIKTGKKLQIKAIVTPTKKINKKLNWSSSNTKYANVNSKGVVLAKKAGKGRIVKITAIATDGSNKKKILKIKIK